MSSHDRDEVEPQVERPRFVPSTLIAVVVAATALVLAAGVAFFGAFTEPGSEPLPESTITPGVHKPGPPIRTVEVEGSWCK